MGEKQEKVFDGENWKLEAEAVINDIKGHILNAEISEGSNQFIYLNLTTIEKEQYCVELSANGFRIVGRNFNDKSETNTSQEYFETPYSLLNSISPCFQTSFSDQLLKKLQNLP